MTRLKELKAHLMEDPTFREEYAQTSDEYALIEALVRARAVAKLTQAELARHLGTTQSAIARLEGGRVSPSFATLRRYAEATGARLAVALVQADTRDGPVAVAGSVLPTAEAKRVRPKHGDLVLWGQSRDALFHTEVVSLRTGMVAEEVETSYLTAHEANVEEPLRFVVGSRMHNPAFGGAFPPAQPPFHDPQGGLFHG